MQSADWLLLLNRDGTVETVDGGAPSSWIARRIDDCDGLPEEVRSAARRLVRDLAEALAGTLLRRIRVAPERSEDPWFTLLAVEAILVRPVAFEPLVRRALEPLLRQAEEAGITLRIESTAGVPLAMSIDANKITWALTALVGNAFRYVRRGDLTMPGGNVGVRLAHNAAQKMVSVTVEDDGPGIPSEVQASLLVSSQVTGRTAGVSLHLVHELVAAHGGGMVIKSSTSPDRRGTAVTLWLPVRG